MGNSAMDIAVESSYVAERTYLAARRGVWIVPKYVFGKPVDQLRNDPRVPFKIRQRIIQQLIRSYAGPPERYGLPKPDHRFGEAHPTVSGRILDRIQHGTITPKPNIDALRGRAGALRRRQRASRRTWSCTAPATRSRSRSSTRTSSRRRTTTSSCSGASSTPSIPNVFFIGLLQPLGAIMPLAEAQGAWVGDYLLGDYALPVARPRCAPTSRPTRRRCARATWPPSATRSRSTTTTICTRSPRSGARAAHGRAQTGISHRRHADLLSPQPLHRALPDLQQDAARPRTEREPPRRAPERRPRGRAPRGRRRRAPGARAAEGAARPSRGARRGRRLPLGAACRACAPRRTRCAWPRRSRSRAGACSRSRLEPPGLYGEVRALAGDGPRAGHLDVLPDRLPVSARGRGPVRRHPPSRSRRAPASCPTSTASRSGRAAPTTRARARRRCSPTASGSQRGGSATVARSRERRGHAGRGVQRAIPRGAPRGASSACSSGSRCPGFARAGRYELLVAARAPRAVRADPRLAAPRRAPRAVIGGPRPRWPPSACSGSATRCCWSAARRRSRRPSAVPVEALDLALANWHSAQRATLGFPRETQRRGRLRARRRRARALTPRAAHAPRKNAVHTAAYSASRKLFPTPGSRRCHSASSSLRTRSA